MRIIQPGQGARRPVLVGFFCPASIGQMAKDLGPRPMVLSVDERREPLKRAQLLERVRLAGGEDLEEVALIGWSAGCHGVRENLRSVLPEVVIALDGTHGSIPQPGGMPLAPWQELVGLARECSTLFVASHIYNTYVEQLKAPDGPYLSTVTALRQLTGWELPEPTGDAPHVRRDGDLIVYSWRSGSCDAPAHAHQVTHVGPMLVRDWLAPRWGVSIPMSAETVAGLLHTAQDAPPDTEPTPETRPKSDAATGQDALVHLARAIAEIGVAEVPGSRSNPRIDEYLSVCERGGHLLGLRGDDQFSWCAAFASWCGLPPGMRPRAAVAELVTDARLRGYWRDNSTWHDPKPGDLAIYARNGQDPRTGGQGHVNRVEHVEMANGVYGAIGGNEDNAVRRSVHHRMDNPVGWIVYPREGP